MSLLWSWVEELREVGAIGLSPDEARHVSARRLRVGSELVLFDGRGRVAPGRIESLGKNSTVVYIESISVTPQADPNFVLATAIPKGDRLSTMLQMLIQLGVVRWQPLLLEESVVKKLDPNSPRLLRILTETCKVARRPWLLEVREPRSLEATLALQPSDASVYFGDREGDRLGFDAPQGLVVIGPEAGFSEFERKSLREAGGRPTSFGAYNLRIETAAVAAAVAAHLARAGGASRDQRE